MVLICGSVVFRYKEGEDRRAVWLGLWLSAGTRLLLPSSTYSVLYMFLLQSAAESLVLVDTRVANGCVVERPSMWIITESRLWLQN